MSVPKNWLLGGWYRRELIVHKQKLTLKYYAKIPYIIQLCINIIAWRLINARSDKK